MVTNTELFFTNGGDSAVTSNRILYTASSFAKSSLLYLQEIGELEAKRGHTNSRTGLQSYLFFIVLSGSGTLMYQDVEYPLCEGDCSFIDCGIPYSHTTGPNRLWVLRWIHFYGSAMPSVYGEYVRSGGRPVFSGEVGSFTDLWEHLMSDARGHDHMGDMRINRHLSELLVFIMEQSRHSGDRHLPAKRQAVLAVKEWIDGNYGSKITLDGLSHQFYIDKYYLSKSFKEHFGQSISSYILSVRITKAKHMLRFTSKTLEEIGAECGIGSPYYFSRKFKEVEGIPPSKYRERW